MKKINIRGSELKRLGFSNAESIRVAIQLAQKNFKRSDKVEMLQTLKSILTQPDHFIHDPVWHELAKLMASKPDMQKATTRPVKKSEGFTIYGADQIDPEAIRQMELAMKLPISIKGALMPDAHLGYGLPIGGVLATYNAVIPYGVGMDIGCRMCLSVFESSPQKVIKDSEQIKKILMSETRFGFATFNDVQEHEITGRKEFSEIPFLKTLHKKFVAQLGTSGHGNHFVDVGYVDIPEYSELIGIEPGKYFAVLSHSGSRNFGAEVCKHYTRVAQQQLGLKGEAGRLAWLELDTEAGQEYWAAMNLAGDYSHANHRIIHSRLAKAFGEEPIRILENHHNFAWKETLETGEEIIIHRKGATPADIGDVGIIPGTMASPAFIVTGKGNEEALKSAAHGAGRLVSRNQAKKTFSEKEMKKYLVEQGVELLGGGLDESPFAYKDIHQVMEYQKELVEINGMFYPKIVRMA